MSSYQILQEEKYIPVFIVSLVGVEYPDTSTILTVIITIIIIWQPKVLGHLLTRFGLSNPKVSVKVILNS
jgi:hypothetical protein